MTHQKKLLIIDDEPSIRGALGSFFEDAGYTVFTAADGENGIALFSEKEPDVVITDLRMPKKDGFHVMEAIHDFSPETPVLVVSGADEKEDVIRALRRGAKDYITKPIPNLEMIEHAVNHAFENYRLIKENKQYRKALEKSEHHYRTITENIAEGVITVDQDETVTYVNNAFCKILGYFKVDITDQPLRDFTTPENVQILRDQEMKSGSNDTRRFEIQLVHKSGKPVHVGFVCTPVFSSKNIYQGFIAVVRDITELTELRHKFKKFLDQSKTEDNNMVSICASCKNIRVSKGNWVPVEEHFMETLFSHSICPKCCDKLYPQFDFSDLE